MSRKKKLASNIFFSLVYNLIILASGFIVPRLIIMHYGSSSNGLVASIMNFLGFFALMEMGVGAVVRSSLYKPLADGDNLAISRVLTSSKRFFSRMGLFLFIYTIGLVFVFPFISETEYSFFSLGILIIAIAFGSISQYLFGVTYEQLLDADQKSYIKLIFASIAVVLSTVISVVLIKLGFSLELVKVISAFTLLSRPFLLNIYIRKKYNINLNASYDKEPIVQKWNGLTQHVALYVLKHSDAVLLTLFSSLKNVSVYYVYHLISSGLESLVNMFSNGFTALFGDMYARNENDKLKKTFAMFEFSSHFLVSFLFGTAILLAIPFVSLYTKNVTDVDYCQFDFAVLFFISGMLFCVRMPYFFVIISAGHFKQTQNCALYEVLLKILISVVLVFKFELVGVAIGTLIAVFYRTVYFIFYLKNNILILTNRSLFYLLFDFLYLGICAFIANKIPLRCDDFHLFLQHAVFSIIFSAVSLCVIGLCFFRKQVTTICSFIKKRGKYE